MRLMTVREKIFRTKNLPAGCLATQMKRCLTTFDISLLGVGHMIGAGIYVLTGTVIRNTAGPSIVGSFFLAGLAALLSALCYAEFGARFPKAGSAYTYAYVGVGELWAFIIGWNIVLEHMLGAAAVARSWSGYLNSLVGDSVKNFTVNNIGSFDGTGALGEYPDLVAFIVVIIVAVFVALGSKTSTHFNNFFTVINLCVITFVVGYGYTFADFGLWTGAYTSPEGTTSFFPFGVKGMFAGAANCFFAYIGFDGLATAGEEAKDPAKSIPHATFISMTIVTTAYILMSSSLSLMVPYFDVDPAAAFAVAFALKGANMAKLAVSLGALCGMTTSLIGAMFALPRCIYAMAEDGLIFRFFARINPTTQVPVNAVAVFGVMTSIIALLFDIATIVEFLSIGTLLAYSIVSACVIILRYQPALLEENSKEMDMGGRLRFKIPGYSFLERLPPGQTIHYGMVVMTLSFASFGICFTSGIYEEAWGVALAITFGILSIASVLFFAAHHQNSTKLAFKVQFVPFVPALSLFINIMMMLNLAPLNWLRLAIWMIFGFAIYFGYGIRHSNEEKSMMARFSKSSTYESVTAVTGNVLTVNDSTENSPAKGAYINQAMTP